MGMPTKMEHLEHMLQGFPDLDHYVAQQVLTTSQKLKLWSYLLGASAYRRVGRFGKINARKSAELDAGMKSVQNLQLRARRMSSTSTQDGYYLSESEITQFEKDGLLGPFPVISPKEAHKLGKYALECHERDFAKNNFIGDRTVEILKRNHAWNINYSGLFQALNMQPFWDLLRCPEIAHPMASLLGDNVICWRSQFFEKVPGDSGTFWHQNASFRETSKQNKLVPTVEVDPGMIQLTAWVALTDVTIETAAIRIIPGTFADGRLEYFYSYALDHTIDFLASMPAEQAKDFLKVALFSSGSFLKAQATFNAMINRFGNIFEHHQVRDLEMKAGECVIFTSLNLHGSYPNTSQNASRLAFAGRFTNNDVKVYPNMTHDLFSSPEGLQQFSLEKVKCIQVHGSDTCGFNKIAPRISAPNEGIA